MRTYSSPQSEVGHTTTVHNYQYAGEIGDETPGLATDDPNTAPVEAGTPPAEMKRPRWADKLELWDEFEPKLIRFTGSMSTPAQSDGNAIEIAGPPKGFCWDIRRVSVFTDPVNSTSLSGSGIISAMFFAVQPGNLTNSLPNMNGNPADGMSGDIDLLTVLESSYDTGESINSAASDSFSKHHVTLLGGYNLGVFVIGNGQEASYYRITGQAILVPEALLMTL